MLHETHKYKPKVGMGGCSIRAYGGHAASLCMAFRDCFGLNFLSREPKSAFCLKVCRVGKFLFLNMVRFECLSHTSQPNDTWSTPPPRIQSLMNLMIV